MKKMFLIISMLTLWASFAMAEEATAEKPAADAGFEERPAKLEVPPEYRFGLGWYGINQSGNPVAGEYDYLKSSGAGALDFEWDPLPHRFVFESYYLNSKDYFGEMDYSWKDVILLNGYARGVFHNLDHYRLGPDDPATPSPSFTDLNPLDVYGVENAVRRGYLRLKTPDFPLHLYADVRTVDREGSIQQRFMTGDLHQFSQSRSIDWNMNEYRVGVNSHLGPVEADYSHMEKKFDPVLGSVLYENSMGIPAPHNEVPNLTSSSDTVKVHTTYSGKIVVAGTYSSGDRKNEDSSAQIKFWNTAGDLMFMPVTPLILTVKYRHYTNDATNPDTAINVTGTGLTTVRVRDSISSSRDMVSSVLRWRATDRLTLRGEYITDTTDRTRGILGTTFAVSTFPPVSEQAYWDLPESTTKNTAKLGVAYRILNRMMFRADYSWINVDNPAYATDPDKATNGRAALTWNVTPALSTALNYGLINEKRDQLSAPLAGGHREAKREQALASATLLVGKYASVNASGGYYWNKIEQTLTFTDGTGLFLLEPQVPYDDKSAVGTVSVTVAPSEGVNVTASASRSYSRGFYVISGTSVPNTSGISNLTTMKVLETVYAISLEMQHAGNVSSELRYQYQDYNDKINDALDGKMNLVLALLSLKW